MGDMLKAKLPDTVQIARLKEEEVTLRRAAVEFNEKLFWADPNFFAVLRPSVLAGDLGKALQQPDSLVLTESAARKYFGTVDAIGKVS